MKYSFLFLALLLALMSCTIEGEGDIVNSQLPVEGPLSGVELQAAYDVDIEYGPQLQVIAEGHSNIIERIFWTVNSEGILELDLDRGNYGDYELKVTVYTPQGFYFENSGSGTMQLFTDGSTNFDSLVLKTSGSGPLNCMNSITVQDALFLEIAGSGDLSFEGSASRAVGQISGSGNMTVTNLQTNQWDAYSTGAGNFTISGYSPSESVSFDGSSNYYGFNFLSQNGSYRHAGSGQIECQASSLLDANLSGSGNLYYKGNPAQTVTITGTGQLIDAN
ncbi:DUF2807 domain-containing protein [Saprospira sp. CCB-QB6]|uniref:GIN domain-containing protein n=1 Tax=Saprospira sp. CCB-QB6 TaxID=3023936 RepID=UPI00234B11E8|nr:DUF2807 domain-containing protein [Saprospira sp. CCB-QB6]WCL81146.1 DUF2807 domain-containing protein [Saprospira sp. CCB-QB6]